MIFGDRSALYVPPTEVPGLSAPSPPLPHLETFPAPNLSASRPSPATLFEDQWKTADDGPSSGQTVRAFVSSIRKNGLIQGDLGEKRGQ